MAREMTTERYLIDRVFPVAVEMIGVPAMDSPEARALLLAIAMQESECRHRRQHGNGPARGFWQFETAGVRGVLMHPKTRPLILPVLATMQVEPYPTACHEAIEHNDVLAMAFARLLLWTLPGRLPQVCEVDESWRVYIAGWRPGKPRRETWDEAFTRAWRFIDELA